MTPCLFVTFGETSGFTQPYCTAKSCRLLTFIVPAFKALYLQKGAFTFFKSFFLFKCDLSFLIWKLNNSSFYILCHYMHRLTTVIPGTEMYNRTKWRNRYLSKINFFNVDTSRAIFFTVLRAPIRFSVLGAKVPYVFCWVMVLFTSRCNISFCSH